MSVAFWEDESESLAGRFRTVRPFVETYSYVDIRSSAAPVTPAILPLFSFVGDGDLKRLRNPLLLRVSIEDGEYFVENDALRIFGHGTTLQAAVESFSHDLAYFWRYYRELSQSQVAGDAITLKQLYEELVG